MTRKEFKQELFKTFPALELIFKEVGCYMAEIPDLKLQAFWHTDEGFTITQVDEQNRPILFGEGDTPKEAYKNFIERALEITNAAIYQNG